MPNPSILTWEGCDSTVQEAIRELQNRWRPSSTGSSGHTLRLLEELIDPAIATYAEKLPQQYLTYLPGVRTEDSFSAIIQKHGLNRMARIQRALLNAFRPLQSTQSLEGEKFVATLETLIGLVNACIRKEDRKNPDKKNREKTKVKNTPLSNTRSKGFCRFCGAPAEFTEFAEPTKQSHETVIYPPTATAEEKQKTLRLSSKYCLDHRPKLASGEWNPDYQKAKRSEEDFKLELGRLYLQSANMSTPCAGTGDLLVDSYIYHYVRLHGFRPGDEAEMRHHARQMVNSRLSDRKKAIVLLQQYAFSQSETARKLGIPRQHVSRDLQSIPDIYRQLPSLRGFPSYFLQ